MNYSVTKYNQGNHNFCSVILPVREILSHSYVLYYEHNENSYGYQRRLNVQRIRRMAKFIIDNPNDLISPSSIILACNSSDFEKISYESHSIHLIDNADTKLFRIVDGQHRIYAFEEAAKTNPSFNDYLLNVIIYVVDEDNRYPEVKVFADINSKAVSVKTDIAILAKHTYSILEDREINPAEYVAVKSIMLLNDDPNNLWSHAIKFDVYNQYESGVIGFKSFYIEVFPIVSLYLNIIGFEKKLSKTALLEQLNDIAYRFNETIINPMWSHVKNKWNACFEKKESSINLFDEKEITYFNEVYYIQKTAGAKAINNLMYEILHETQNIEEYIKTAQKVIENSYLSSENWKKGDIFTGMSSFSGAKYIKDQIKNGK